MAATLKKIQELIDQNRFLEKRTEELKNLIETNISRKSTKQQVNYSELITSTEIENLVFKFYQNNKIPTAVFDREGRLIFSIGWKKISDNFTNAETAKVCCNQIIQLAEVEKSSQKFFLYKCPDGFNAIALPVEVRDKTIAILLLNQFFYSGEIPDLQFFRNLPHLSKLGDDELVDLITEIPVFTKDEISQITEQGLIIAEMISFVAGKNLEFKERFGNQSNNELVLKALKDKIIEQENLIQVFKQIIIEHEQYVQQNTVSRSEMDAKVRNLSSQLDRNELLLNSLLTSVPLGIGFVKKNIFTYVNDQMFKLTGYTPKELIGRSPFIFKDGIRNWNDLLKQTDRYDFFRENASFETKIKTKNNEIRDVMVFIGLLDSDLHSEGFTVSFLDITEIKKVEEELKFAKEKAEESDKLKNAFLTNMSHEIRSPLNAIIGFSELICSHTLGTIQKDEYFNIIKSSGQDLIRMIDDIVDMSKLSTNQMVLDIGSYSLHKLLREIQNVYESYLDKKCCEPIRIILKEPENSVRFDSYFTDGVRFKQIFCNLLNNAIKFSKEGDIEFGYSVEDGGKSLQFYVKDFGPGIKRNQLKYIFTHFRQGDETHARLYNGVGLGLAISKNLVELMGGKIWVESKPGKGSIFYFKLPVDAQIPVHKNNGASVSESKQQTYDWSSKTILLAEDEEINYLFIRKLLASTNVNIKWVNNGQKAIEAFSQDPAINLVLMDIKMPVLNGIEATRIIKSRYANIPVIAQTAYANDDNRKEIIRAGCDEFIAKPINTNLLMSVLGRFLEAN